MPCLFWNTFHCRLGLRFHQVPKFGRGVEEEVGFALLRVYPFLRMIEDGEYELPIATKMPREKYLMGYVSKKGAQKSDADFEWKDGGRPSFRLRLRCQSSIFNQARSCSGFCLLYLKLLASHSNGWGRLESNLFRRPHLLIMISDF